MMKDNKEKKGVVLDIQRMSTEDGPGIRTTVFFKGCSLSCAWCHNPESISKSKMLQWVETRCMGCGICVETCKNNALTMSDTGIKIDREKCEKCFECVKECPTSALEIKGADWSVDELFDEVMQDYVYFEKSDGGVTLSGGEALLQYEFLSDFLKKLKSENVNTAIDTCGMCSQEAFKEVLPYTDLFLYDIKLMDDELHKKYTGHSNKQILKNIIYLADMIRKEKKSTALWIRTPIIPNATDSVENITAIGEFIANNISDVVIRWELCTFNNLCRDKYERLDIDWMFKDAELIEKEKMDYLVQIAKDTGIASNVVRWTGSTKMKE